MQIKFTSTRAVRYSLSALNINIHETRGSVRLTNHEFSTPPGHSINRVALSATPAFI